MISSLTFASQQRADETDLNINAAQLVDILIRIFDPNVAENPKPLRIFEPAAVVLYLVRPATACLMSRTSQECGSSAARSPDKSGLIRSVNFFCAMRRFLDKGVDKLRWAGL